MDEVSAARDAYAETLDASVDLLAHRAAELSSFEASIAYQAAIAAATNERPKHAAEVLYERMCLLVTTSWLTVHARDGERWLWTDTGVAVYCRVRELRGAPVVDRSIEGSRSRVLRGPVIGYAYVGEGGG